jgi:prepilin-type N-terminal cleavage/methylation domain-containing protein
MTARIAARTARKGFTLVEVMAVVAIIMVLVGLSAFAVTSQLERAKKNEAYIKMGKIEQAAKNYYIQAGSVWPTTVQDLVNPGPDGVFLEGGDQAITDPWGGQFVLSITTDASGQERPVVTCTAKDGTPLTWPRN